jgi:hypothetical protein
MRQIFKKSEVSSGATGNLKTSIQEMILQNSIVQLMKAKSNKQKNRKLTIKLTSSTSLH